MRGPRAYSTPVHTHTHPHTLTLMFSLGAGSSDQQPGSSATPNLKSQRVPPRSLPPLPVATGLPWEPQITPSPISPALCFNSRGAKGDV